MNGLSTFPFSSFKTIPGGAIKNPESKASFCVALTLEFSSLSVSFPSYPPTPSSSTSSIISYSSSDENDNESLYLQTPRLYEFPCNNKDNENLRRYYMNLDERKLAEVCKNIKDIFDPKLFLQYHDLHPLHFEVLQERDENGKDININDNKVKIIKNKKKYLSKTLSLLLILSPFEASMFLRKYQLQYKNLSTNTMPHGEKSRKNEKKQPKNSFNCQPSSSISFYVHRGYCLGMKILSLKYFRPMYHKQTKKIILSPQFFLPNSENKENIRKEDKCKILRKQNREQRKETLSVQKKSSLQSSINPSSISILEKEQESLRTSFTKSLSSHYQHHFINGLMIISSQLFLQGPQAKKRINFPQSSDSSKTITNPREDEVGISRWTNVPFVLDTVGTKILDLQKAAEIWINVNMSTRQEQQQKLRGSSKKTKTTDCKKNLAKSQNQTKTQILLAFVRKEMAKEIYHQSRTKLKYSSESKDIYDSDSDSDSEYESGNIEEGHPHGYRLGDIKKSKRYTRVRKKKYYNNAEELNALFDKIWVALGTKLDKWKKAFRQRSNDSRQTTYNYANTYSMDRAESKYDDEDDSCHGNDFKRKRTLDNKYADSDTDGDTEIGDMEHDEEELSESDILSLFLQEKAKIGLSVSDDNNSDSDSSEQKYNRDFKGLNSSSSDEYKKEAKSSTNLEYISSFCCRPHFKNKKQDAKNKRKVKKLSVYDETYSIFDIYKIFKSLEENDLDLLCEGNESAFQIYRGDQNDVSLSYDYEYFHPFTVPINLFLIALAARQLYMEEEKKIINEDTKKENHRNIKYNKSINHFSLTSNCFNQISKILSPFRSASVNQQTLTEDTCSPLRRTIINDSSKSQSQKYSIKKNSDCSNNINVTVQNVHGKWINLTQRLYAVHSTAIFSWQQICILYGLMTNDFVINTGGYFITNKVHRDKNMKYTKEIIGNSFQFEKMIDTPILDHHQPQSHQRIIPRVVKNGHTDLVTTTTTTVENDIDNLHSHHVETNSDNNQENVANNNLDEENKVVNDDRDPDNDNNKKRREKESNSTESETTSINQQEKEVPLYTDIDNQSRNSHTDSENQREEDSTDDENEDELYSIYDKGNIFQKENLLASLNPALLEQIRNRGMESSLLFNEMSKLHETEEDSNRSSTSPITTCSEGTTEESEPKELVHQEENNTKTTAIQIEAVKHEDNISQNQPKTMEENTQIDSTSPTNILTKGTITDRNEDGERDGTFYEERSWEESRLSQTSSLTDAEDEEESDTEYEDVDTHSRRSNRKVEKGGIIENAGGGNTLISHLPKQELDQEKEIDQTNYNSYSKEEESSPKKLNQTHLKDHTPPDFA